MRKSKAFIIGVSGVARGGKDMLAASLIRSLHKKGISAKKFALAGLLKREMKSFLMSTVGIDPESADGEQKGLIRPILVEYGRMRRKMSEGTYWSSKVLEEIDSSNLDIAVVSDVRYAEYENDEAYIIQRGGMIIHVSRIMNGGGSYPPANQDERENDPRIFALSDITVAVKDGAEDADMDFHVERIFQSIKDKWAEWKR